MTLDQTANEKINKNGTMQIYPITTRGNAT